MFCSHESSCSAASMLESEATPTAGLPSITRATDALAAAFAAIVPLRCGPRGLSAAFSSDRAVRLRLSSFLALLSTSFLAWSTSFFDTRPVARRVRRTEGSSSSSSSSPSSMG